MSTDGIRPPQPATAQLPPQRSLPQVQIPGRNQLRVMTAMPNLNIAQLAPGTTLFGTNKIFLQLQPTSITPAMGQNLGQTIRLSVPVTGVTNVAPGALAVRSGAPISNLPPSTVISSRNGQSNYTISQPLTIQTTTANNQAASAQSSQMSPNTAKTKCKNFLATLVKLASEQQEHTSRAVKSLIQSLIDGTIQPEDFTNQLQNELHSAPQPCLVPFLKRSLPHLRHSLMVRELSIDGIRPPPPGSVQLPIQQSSASQILIPPGARNNVRLINSSAVLGLRAGTTALIANPTRHHTPISFSTLNSSTATTITAVTTSQIPNKLHQLSSTPVQVKAKPATAKSRSPAVSRLDKDKRGFATTLKDDDDINDVAAMGGVNLVEESQRILATNAEFVGAQIRSCKDENFLFTNPLQTRINEIARKFGLDDVPSDVVSLVSHAAQERLKTLVEKLGVIAAHRMENFKNDPRYEVTQDVRAQTKFLEELDRLEKKRHEEQEREMLLRAAKSRSKLEDPEQLKLKQKAKEMQRAELEEARQREANETALQAIGPRKKLKTVNNMPDNSSSSYLFSTNHTNNNQIFFSNNTSKTQVRRLKRVNFRDLQFLMEQEREMVRSRMLYKSYIK